MDEDSVSQTVGGGGSGREVVRVIRVDDLPQRDELESQIAAVRKAMHELRENSSAPVVVGVAEGLAPVNSLGDRERVTEMLRDELGRLVKQAIALAFNATKID